jgi:hypothetical protein
MQENIARDPGVIINDLALREAVSGYMTFSRLESANFFPPTVIGFFFI